ncbi:MAG: GWxTD domain-containing protein [Candidatus Krumholzibacteriales bacterium]
MKVILIIAVSAVILAACTPCPVPESPNTEIYSVTGDLNNEQILRRIESLKYALRENPDDYELNRLLAVYYKLEGTPHSRSLAVKQINRAIEIRPADPGLYIEKGKINMERRFFGEAEDSFSKALELDPYNLEALCHLGSLEKREYTLSMRYPFHAENAAAYYRRAFEINPAREEALREFMILNILTGNTREAEKFKEIMSKNFPESFHTYMLLGIIDLENKNFLQAEERFKKALELMPHDEKSFYSAIAPIVPADQRPLIRNLNEKRRENYLRNFWIERDPTPTTEVNERYMEHLRRVYYARYLFQNSRMGQNGPDTDRGRSLIKYGMPEKIETSFYRGTGRIGDAATAYHDKSWNVDPINSSVISWSYGFNGGGFKLYFLDEFLNGDYHIPIDTSYAMISNANRMIEYLVPEVYNYPIDFGELGISTQAVQRKGPAGQTTILISTIIPVQGTGGGKQEFYVSYSMRDINNNRIYHDDKIVISDTLRAIQKGRRRYMLTRHALNLLPRVGNCRMHVACVDSLNVRKGISGGQLEFIDFSTSRLILSEISLSMPDNQNGCSIWPDGDLRFTPGSHICIAYEIYNLGLNSSHESEYILTYSIIPVEEGDREQKGFLSGLVRKFREIAGLDDYSYISNSITQNSNSSSAGGRLTISTESLKDGLYLLSLEVDDLIEGEKAKREKGFELALSHTRSK